MDPIADQAPRILAAIWALMAFSTIFLGLRLYCKVSRRRGFWWDDYTLIVSWVLLLISVILSHVNTTLGLGKHIYAVPVENLATLSFNVYLCGTFSIYAAILSKTSFALTLLRISEGWMKYLIWFIIVSINVSMGLSALFGWIQCSPVAKVWDITLPGTCWSPHVYAVYGMVAAAYSGIMDIVLAILPWKTILGLQMRLKEKIGVAIAMSMGIFAGATALVKTVAIPTLLDDGDFTYRGADLVIWGTAETAVTIIAASIPVLRMLIQDVKRTARMRSESDHARSGHLGSRLGKSFVTVTASAPYSDKDSTSSGTGNDDWSGRNVLERSSNGGIVQKSEIRVERSESSEEELCDKVPYGPHAV